MKINLKMTLIAVVAGLFCAGSLDVYAGPTLKVRNLTAGHRYFGIGARPHLVIGYSVGKDKLVL